MSGSTGARPAIRCFPSADRQFRAAVEHALGELGEASGTPAAERLEVLLRERYPTARVSPQDPLASFTGETTVWYVYRRDQPAPAPADAPPDGANGKEARGAEPSAATKAARPIYSAAAVSSMLGVPVSILVGWDEQDGYVQPQPMAGVRLYSRDDLEDLVTVKRLTTAGAKPEQIHEALEADRARRRRGPFGAGRAGRRMLVLLAERDPYAAEMAEYFLRTEGFDVDVAFSTAEAESQAGERPPDVAVVELLISGGAGAELCARLKAQTGGRIVAISTLDFEEAALRSGADAFLRKPLDPLELVSTIKDLLGESALLKPAVGT
jgi:CheY-like chemotaxis protein